MTEIGARRIFVPLLRRVPRKHRPMLWDAYYWYWGRNRFRQAMFWVRNPRLYLIVRSWKTDRAVIQA